ncbi:MAG: nuclease superfamily protein, partial [Pseudomonadota bacterium]|nr:nuclease superfamily protein [Pseudomonadota bacterium]
RELSRADLRALPAVAKALAEAEAQLAQYRQALEVRYGERLRLRTHAVVALGLDRLVWA